MERINRCSYIKLYFSRARLFCWSVNHYNDILIIFQKRGKRQIICINGGYNVSSNGPNEGESGSAWGSLTGPVGPVGSLSSTSFERQKPTRRLDGSASLSNGIHCLICFISGCKKGERPVTQPSFLPQRRPFIWPHQHWKRGAFLGFSSLHISWNWNVHAARVAAWFNSLWPNL